MPWNTSHVKISIHVRLYPKIGLSKRIAFCTTSVSLGCRTENTFTALFSKISTVGRPFAGDFDQRPQRSIQILDEGSMNERMPSSLYESSSSFEIHEGESSESYDVAVSNIGRECVDDETLDQTPEGSIDVEEWLIKQRALSENCGRSADYERRGNPAQVPSITKISYFQATHDTTDCSTKAGVRSVNLHPPIHYNNSNESLQHRNDEHSPTSEAISSAVTADVEFAFTSSRQGQDFIVEVSALVNNLDQPIVVAAKRVKDPNNRRLATLICLVVAAVIVIVTAAVLKLNRNEANGTNDQPTPDVSREPNISSTTFPASTSINTTIGDSWASLGKSLTIVGLLSESGKIYLNTLQRTDTYFTVVSFNIDLLPAEMNWTLLARYSDPLWSGHTVRRHTWESKRIDAYKGFACFLSHTVVIIHS